MYHDVRHLVGEALGELPAEACVDAQVRERVRKGRALQPLAEDLHREAVGGGDAEHLVACAERAGSVPIT